MFYKPQRDGHTRNGPPKPDPRNTSVSVCLCIVRSYSASPTKLRKGFNVQCIMRRSMCLTVPQPDNRERSRSRGQVNVHNHLIQFGRRSTIDAIAASRQTRTVDDALRIVYELDCPPAIGYQLPGNRKKIHSAHSKLSELKT